MFLRVCSTFIRACQRNFVLESNPIRCRGEGAGGGGGGGERNARSNMQHATRNEQAADAHEHVIFTQRKVSEEL